MKKTTVVNKNHQEYDIYIGRGSKWGNPFKIGKDGSREEVIEKYAKWIKTQQHLLDSLHELRGMRLGCFCRPSHCHGDVLVDIINDMENCGAFKERDIIKANKLKEIEAMLE